MRNVAIFGCVAAAACSGPPVAPASGTTHAARQCFYASEVTGFSDNGPGRALLNIGTQETWELELSPGCPDANWAMNIGIVSRGGERICSGRPAELIVPSASGQSGQRCLVRNVRKLSAEEAAKARGQAIKH